MRFSKKNPKQRHLALFSLWDQISIFLVSAVAILLTLILTENDSLPDFDREAAAAENLAQKVSCDLIRVIDGDTVAARCQRYEWRIRLLGIDAPEIGQVPWGAYSKRTLTEHLTDEFVLVNQGFDVYQRVLGTIYAGNEDINLLMVARGAAVAYDGAETPQAYFIAEKRAKNSKLGIWSKSGDQQDPRLWRRYHQ